MARPGVKFTLPNTPIFLKFFPTNPSVSYYSRGVVAPPKKPTEMPFLGKSQKNVIQFTGKYVYDLKTDFFFYSSTVLKY